MVNIPGYSIRDSINLLSGNRVLISNAKDYCNLNLACSPFPLTPSGLGCCRRATSGGRLVGTKVATNKRPRGTSSYSSRGLGGRRHGYCHLRRSVVGDVPNLAESLGMKGDHSTDRSLDRQGQRLFWDTWLLHHRTLGDARM